MRLLRARRGSLLLVTLWLIAVLAVLAVAISRFLSLEIRLAAYRAAREQARALARGGVYLAMERLAQDAAAPETGGAAYDWLSDEWAAFPQADPSADPSRWTLAAGAGKFVIQIRDEERRLDLNAASAAQLARLTGDAALAQAIVDARDAPDPAEDLPGAAPPYFAKNAPFAAPEELGDLPGMQAEPYALLAARTSPYRRSTDPINLNTAPADVLRAAGLADSTVGLVLGFRERGVFQQAGVVVLEALKDGAGVDLTGTPDGNLLISNLFGVASATFTVTVEGRVAQPPVTARVEAVIRREGCEEGQPAPCVLAWREG